MEESYDYLFLEEEPSSEDEPYNNYLSPEEIVSSVFKFLVTVFFSMFYLSRFPLGLFKRFSKDPMDVFLKFNCVQAAQANFFRIMEPYDHLEPSEDEPCDYLSQQEIASSLFNSLVTVHFLMFYFYRSWFLYAWFRRLCNFLLYVFKDPKDVFLKDQQSKTFNCVQPLKATGFRTMEEPYHDHLESSEEVPYNYLSPIEISSSLYNFLVSGSLLMFYLSRFPLYGFFASAIILSIYHIENEERDKIKIISPMIPTYMEFSDPRLQSSEEEMVTSLFNVLMIGSILLFYLWWFPLGLFRDLCNSLMFGFFSLTIMMIFIFADDPKKEVSWLLSSRIDKDKRKPGDHIYTWRGGYAHHGICTEDGNVIHFARGERQGYGTVSGLDPFISNSTSSHSKGNPRKSCTSCGNQSNLEGVISSCIECFLSRGDLYLFQYFITPALFLAKVRGGTCTLVPSDPLEVVLNRAKVLLRTNDFGVYHILRNNCESFSYYCKTGSPFFSGQVVSFLVAVFVLAGQLTLSTRSTGLAVTEGFVVYCACRYIIDRGSNEQRLKSPVTPIERLRLLQLWDFGLLTPNFVYFFFYGVPQKICSYVIQIFV